MTLASYRARSSHKNKGLSHELKLQNIYTKNREIDKWDISSPKNISEDYIGVE